VQIVYLRANVPVRISMRKR